MKVCILKYLFAQILIVYAILYVYRSNIIRLQESQEQARSGIVFKKTPLFGIRFLFLIFFICIQISARLASCLASPRVGTWLAVFSTPTKRIFLHLNYRPTHPLLDSAAPAARIHLLPGLSSSRGGAVSTEGISFFNRRRSWPV